jgi:hypothetical protein
MGTRGTLLRRFAVVALAAAAWLLVAGAPVAGAAPGALVSTVHGDFAAGGVSVAFDGTYLYYNNFNEPVIHRMTTRGVPVPPDIVTTPLIGINAFSYDATRNMFWAADETGQGIWLIDKAGNAVLQFTVMGKLFGNCDNATQAGGPSPGCDQLVDGLAYDGTDDSIWYSPDRSERVYHFTTTGDLIGFFDVNDGPATEPSNAMLPECPPMPPDQLHGNFNSGIGVGANVTYLTAGQCRFFFEYGKNPMYNPIGLNPVPCPATPNPPNPLVDPTNPSTFSLAAPGTSLPGTYCPGNKIDFFAYPGERAEDLECDDQTFRVNVMWVRDAEDGNFRAFELPTGTCIFGGGVAIPVDKDRMTGGGGLPVVDSYGRPTGDIAHHGFMIHCDANARPDRLQVTWGGGNRFHMTGIEMSKCSDSNGQLVPNANGASFDTIEGSGFGRYNGMLGGRVQWRFTDNGEPGKNDTGEITVFDQNNVPVMHAGGVLLPGTSLLGEGNYQTHDAP